MLNYCLLQPWFIWKNNNLRTRLINWFPICLDLIKWLPIDYILYFLMYQEWYFLCWLLTSKRLSKYQTTSVHEMVQSTNIKYDDFLTRWLWYFQVEQSNAPILYETSYKRCYYTKLFLGWITSYVLFSNILSTYLSRHQ